MNPERRRTLVLLSGLFALGASRDGLGTAPARKKPMDVIREWRKYKQWIAKKVPLYHQRLNGPAKPEEITALEAELGVRLPEDLKQLYLENNGERDDDFRGGSMMGLTFLSLQKVAFHWKQYVLFFESPDFTNTTSWLTSVPAGAVQDLYFHRKWIPLFTDRQANFLGLDLEPGPNGKAGQFINFGTREEEHCLIADGVTSFLRLVNEKLEKHAREVAIIEDGGKKLVYGIMGEGHLTDDLRWWTRERYGVSHPHQKL